MNDITRRLDLLRGNTSDESPDNTREQNSKIIARKNQERFQNRQIREREREIKNIPKGIINKRKSKKTGRTDAKPLVLIHALAALNIHFGGNKYISQTAIGEYLQNLTYQVLIQENDKIFVSYDNIGLLVNDLLKQFVCKENNESDGASVMSEKVNNKLKTNFQSVLSPEMKIQKGEEDKEIETKPKQIDASTPFKRLEESYQTEKETFLKTALTINQIDLERATDAADAGSEALFEETINPTPGYVIDDKVNVNTQFDFQNSDLDTSFKLGNTQARLRVSNLKFPGEATVDIPNDDSYSDSKIVAEDIYIDDSLKDMLYPGDPIYFLQPSTDDRKIFELNVSGDDLIILKSPILNFVRVAKEDFRDFFDKIIEDLDLNLEETLMSEEEKTEKKQKITIVKNINKRFSLMKKTDIEQQLQSHKCLNQLNEDQMKLSKTSFGDEYKSNKLKKKFRNVTTRIKRKSFSTDNYFPLRAHDALPLTSEERLRDISSIYTKIPTDRAKKQALHKTFLVI